MTGANSGPVEIWARGYGESTERLVATTTVLGLGDNGYFSAVLAAPMTNTRLRIEYLGSPSALNSAQSMTLQVVTRVSLSANTTPRPGAPVALSARVTPRTFGGSVVFERLDGRVWRRIATVAAPSGVARTQFTPRGDTRVRARTVSSASNASGSSPTLIIRPR